VTLLLDECIDQRFAGELAGHEVKTVPQMGWAGKKNGELIRLAQGRFDAFVTVDRNLSSQQNLPAPGLAVVVLIAPSNRLMDLRPLAAELLEKLAGLQPGSVTTIP